MTYLIESLAAVILFCLAVIAVSVVHDKAGARMQRYDRDRYGHMSLDEWYETTPRDADFLPPTPVDPYPDKRTLVLIEDAS